MPLYAPSGPSTAATYRMATDWLEGQLAAASNGIYVIDTTGTMRISTGTTTGLGVFYIDPADYAVTGLSTYYRVIAMCNTNATAPAVTLTYGLYPVSAVAGGTGQNSVTLGTVTTGSTVAFATPALSTRNQGNSGDFAAVTAGYYVIAVSTSGATAALSTVLCAAALQVRNV